MLHQLRPKRVSRPRPRFRFRPRRFLLRVLLPALALLLVWRFLPGDEADGPGQVELVGRWWWSGVQGRMKGGEDEWLRVLHTGQVVRQGGHGVGLGGAGQEVGMERINMRKDVGIVIKTGYGTRERAGALLGALEELGGIEWDDLEGGYGGVVVVGDWGGSVEVIYAPKGGSEDEGYRESAGEDALDTAGEATAASGNGKNEMKGERKVKVHDVIAMSLENGWISPEGERIEKYERLQRAVRAGDEEEAGRVAREVGWELDALKFLPALQTLHKSHPTKPFYLLLHDDTLLHPPTLSLLLSHLPSPFSHPLYAGNPVGDYTLRFAHGGSAVILSNAALSSRLFSPSYARALARGHVESGSEKWGNRLLARALQRTGVRVEEGLAGYFNGEVMRGTRIGWSERRVRERVCAPIVGFHKVNSVERIWEGAGMLRQLSSSSPSTSTSATASGLGASRNTEGGDGGRDILLWKDIWTLYEGTALEDMDVLDLYMRKDRDHVGSLGFDGVDVANAVVWAGSAGGCAQKCKARGAGCLAWCWREGGRAGESGSDGDDSEEGEEPTWIDAKGKRRKNGGECKMIPWFIVGEEKAEGSWSGFNVKEVLGRVEGCERRWDV